MPVAFTAPATSMPVAFTAPATSSFTVGEDMPMPTLPVSCTTNTVEVAFSAWMTLPVPGVAILTRNAGVLTTLDTTSSFALGAAVPTPTLLDVDESITRPAAPLPVCRSNLPPFSVLKTVSMAAASLLNVPAELA